MVTVFLVGARGYGAVHLRNLERLGERTTLVGLADPQGAPDEGYGHDIPCWPSLDEALNAGIHADIVIIATPTNSHFPLAQRALEAGSHVYLEKPPVASIAQFEDLLAIQKRTGLAIQVGFQSFGSEALEELAKLGTPSSVATWAGWQRDEAYWTRSAWAGKRTLGGFPVVDGVLTNALSHAVATALHVAGARRREDIERVELELLRAADIEADDTSSVRITLRDGRLVSAALTLAADVDTRPLIEVRTASADVVYAFREDQLIFPGDNIVQLGTVNLFEQLLDHLDTGVPLLSALIDTGAYMEVLEAVRTAPDPAHIAEEFTTRVDGRISVDNVSHWIARTARSSALFSEMHAPFAPRVPQGNSTAVTIHDREIVRTDDGAAVTATSGPRPFLHSVRTFGGITVTDEHPADHDWHLGVSFAIQDVNGVNFWGGPTYVRDQGYRWLDNHGRIELTSLEHTEHGFTRTALWHAPDSTVLLSESTQWEMEATADARSWSFRTSTTLQAGDTPVSLGSPGSNGRSGGGYGGFTWRFPAAHDVQVHTPRASGEDAVHGTVSPWIAFSAHFPDGPATVALAADDAETALDPWFVRVTGYPGIGSALAWERPVRLAPGAHLTRSFHGIVADGALTTPEVDALLAESGRHLSTR